jgi:hypothetical protein
VTKTIEITKEEALAAYAGNQAALGRALGVTRQAVHAMPDGPIAEGYALKLRFVLKPDVFGSGAVENVHQVA